MKIEKDDGTFVYKCDYCGKEFNKAQQVGAHITHCKDFYLKRDGNLDNWNKATKVSADKNRYTYTEVERICPKCGNKYKTKYCKQTREYQHKYCSKKCANSHPHTEEQKLKIGQSLKQYYTTFERKTKSAKNDKKF